MLLASGDPDNGAGIDEYGPLDEAIYYLVNEGTNEPDKYIIRLLLAIQIATEETGSQRLGCMIERAIAQAFAYSEHGQESRASYIRAIEQGGKL